jgi:hypothetical protein
MFTMVVILENRWWLRRLPDQAEPGRDVQPPSARQLRRPSAGIRLFRWFCLLLKDDVCSAWGCCCYVPQRLAM